MKCVASRRGAFTLVELLVVIGIIAVLISILLPTMGRARRQAQTVQCMSNLRGVGQGLIIYANANKGSLPWGDFLDPTYGYTPESETANWVIRVATALKPGAQGENFMTSTTSKGIFRCPSANIESSAEDKIINHYSAHPKLMPNFNAAVNPLTNKRDTPYKLGKIRNSAEIIMVVDGTQYFSSTGFPDGNAHPVANGMDNWRANANNSWGNGGMSPCVPQNSWDANYNVPLDAVQDGDVVSYTGNQQNIRFRHGNNDTANTLFSDGHVASFHMQPKKKNYNNNANWCVSDLQRKNFAVNMQ